jgi:L-ascorbate metabolism protein UlaG (beta-lactamase superfamily)
MIRRVADDSLTWIGHATVLIEVGDARILTDPLLRSRLGHLRRHGRAPEAAALRNLDAVLVSHLHLDHLDLPSLRRLDHGVPLLVPRGAGDLLRRSGFPHAQEVAVGDRVTIGGVEVVAVHAEHDGGRHPLNKTEADTLGFVIESPTRRVYFAGDTDLFDDMAALAGTLDAALIPVWGWGPSLGEGHLDPGRAAQAAAMLAPRLAVPIHWGTFYPRALHRLRPAPLRDPPHAFAAQVAELAAGVEVRVLAPGGSVALPSP